MAGINTWASVGVMSFVLIIVWGPSPSEQNHYCSISRDHTLCKFQGVGPRCSQPLELGIGTRERSQILGLHNSLRQMVATGAERRGRGGAQPEASNMRQMEWDDELALSAQRLAEQCKYNHDCLNCRKVDRFLTGQNLYQFSENIERSGSNWDQAIMAWYDEVADWSPRHIDHFEFIKPLGHYTQMLWADTWKVGCGYVYYRDGKWNRKLYVCNYGPAGNIITTQMYKRGQPCAECPDGTSCSNSYPGLCSGGGGGSRPSFSAPRPTTTPRPPPPTHAPTHPPTHAPTTRRTTTTTTTTTRRPTTHRTYPTYQPTTQRTFPPPTTTQRTFKTTTHPSKIIFNELESNELGSDTFSTHKNQQKTKYNPFHTHHTQPSFNRFQYKTTPRPTTTTTTTTERITTTHRPTTTPRLTFSRFVTSPTTRKPNSTPAPYKHQPYQFFNQNPYRPHSSTTSAPPTTKRTFTFSPRVYPTEEGKRNRIKNSIDSFPSRRPHLATATSTPPSINSQYSNRNKFNNYEQGKTTGGRKPETKVVRLSETPALSVEDSNTILLFCDFDHAKCPVRSMGREGWNYTAYETPGYGHGFSSIVRPGADSMLQIRSDIFPTSRDGKVCVHFRFVHYLFGTDGGFPKSSGRDPSTNLPLAFRVNAGPLNPSEGNPTPNTRVEFSDKSKSAYDWLTGSIQFKDLHSQFLLSFEVPRNPLGLDNQYLALDDILITQGNCHT